MATVVFDQGDKLHQDLFESFKQDLISETNNKDKLTAKYNNYVDELNLILREIAVEELDLDSDISEFESWWGIAIYNNKPSNFGIIIAFEYVDQQTDESMMDFIKVSGELLIENNKLIIFNIDQHSIDYSNKKEFKKAKQSYKFKH